MNKSKIAIGYVRVSTDRQDISPEDQAAQMRAYCQFKTLPLSETLIEIGVSGSVPLLERPQGRRLAAVEPGTAIIAVKLDRLFRDAIDCLTLTRQWDESGVALHILDMGGNSMDTSTAMGRMFLTMASGFAELERNLGRERTKAALLRLKKTGRSYGRLAFGYDSGPNGTIIPNEAEVQAVREIVRRRASGETLAALAGWLEGGGFRPKTEGKKWSPGAVRDILGASLARSFGVSTENA